MDMIFKGYLFSVLYALICLLFAFMLYKVGVEKKITRKIVHILVGFIAFSLVVEGLDNNTYLKINVINVWNTECTTYTGAFPAESIKVEFTVSGLGAGAADATDAPAAGDVDASTDSSKGSPDTGIEDVAVIGGLAVLAGAAIAFTRKRK